MTGTVASVGPWRRRAARVLPALLATLLAVPALAAADDQVTAFAGGVLDNASYGSVGFQAALPGSSGGHGPAIRGSAFVGDYDYGDYLGQSVESSFVGGEVDAVYSWSGKWGYLDAFAGARNMDTRLTPVDPSNRRLGDQTEPVVGADGAEKFGPWRSDWYAAYGTRLEDYQTRVSLAHRVSDRLRLGAEVGFEGDPTYALQRIGPFVGFAVNPHSEVQASVGISRQDGRHDRGYLRVGWYRSF